MISSRIRTRKRAAVAVAAVAVACLGISACSSSKSSPSTGSSGSSSSSSTGGSQNATGTPIKIGYAASMSGAQAQNGISAQGVSKAWEAYTNAHGGILGHPVQITMVDTKTAVPSAVSAMKGFINDKSYDAIMLTDLVSEGALGDTVKGSDVAILSGGGSADIFWTSTPNVFQDVSGSDYVVKGYVDAAKSAGATKFGWAACAEVAVCSQLGGTAQTYAKSIGMTPTGVQQISASAADYTAQCLAFIQKGTDAIAFNIGYPVGVRMATDCIQQGYKGTFSVINSGFDQASFQKVQGFKSEGGTQGFPWWATDNPQVKTYLDAMQQYAPNAIRTSGNATSIWSTFELLKKALEDAKPATIDRASVLAAMYQVKNETLGGLLPQPITFTQGQPSKKVSCSWLFTYDGGDASVKGIPSPKSGNGATGDMASTCLGYLPGTTNT